MPIDKRGADLLFQIISHRYERGAIVLTKKRASKNPLTLPFPPAEERGVSGHCDKLDKHRVSIFNNDGALTSGVLDRVLHHTETIVINGKSYRMKGRIEP